ncbi:hypothetical protein C8Q80DRAFT_424045 [Daedaleopsis nitida]|nr:hypothetical protein C8Q80DRAFT_424045 [Daedaleopsis nitida]
MLSVPYRSPLASNLHQCRPRLPPGHCIHISISISISITISYRPPIHRLLSTIVEGCALPRTRRPRELCMMYAACRCLCLCHVCPGHGVVLLRRPGAPRRARLLRLGVGAPGRPVGRRDWWGGRVSYPTQMYFSLSLLLIPYPYLLSVVLLCSCSVLRCVLVICIIAQRPSPSPSQSARYPGIWIYTPTHSQCPHIHIHYVHVHVSVHGSHGPIMHGDVRYSYIPYSHCGPVLGYPASSALANRRSDRHAPSHPLATSKAPLSPVRDSRMCALAHAGMFMAMLLPQPLGSAAGVGPLDRHACSRVACERRARLGNGSQRTYTVTVYVRTAWTSCDRREPY